MRAEHYKGNPNLKAVNVPVSFTQQELDQYTRCQNDPLYFAEHFVQIVNVDKGVIPFRPYDYQKRMIDAYTNNRFVITKLPRQSGKSTSVISFLLWKILFTPNQTIAICAHKGQTARELLDRLKKAYELLPKWVQQGVVNWNKGEIEIENGSRIIAAATTSAAIRGNSFNCIFLDEFAFVPRNLADDFFASVYPTISSGKSTQVIIVSTPNGMNHFYDMWLNAKNKKSEYIPIEIDWRETPGRDEKWKRQQIRNTSEAQFAQEFECLFLGGENTLINPNVLNTLVMRNPIAFNQNVAVFENPQKGHHYVIVVDTSRGVENDASAFLVFDVTTLPYKVVSTFQNNTVPPELFPSIIIRAAQRYNNAFCLIEINDIGGQVAELLHSEFEYENIFTTTSILGKGQRLGGSGKNAQLGVRTTRPVKRIGCAHLKTLIEDRKLEFYDSRILKELTSFIQKRNSFEAEDGAHDDMVMCMVLFSWMINQPYYKEAMDINIRERILADNMRKLQEDVTPFGFVVDQNNFDVHFDDDDIVL